MSHPYDDMNCCLDCGRHRNRGHEQDCEYWGQTENSLGEEWAEPRPFAWTTTLPAWPSGAFPPVPGAFVEAVAEETQTPLDLPAVAVLGVLAAAVGGRLDVQCPTWSEPTNLFVVPVLPPGSRKSAVIATCRAPLDDAELQLRELLADEVRDQNTKREILQQYADQCMREASKNPTPEAIAEAQSATKAVEEVPPRTRPRLVTSDATPEAMVSLLAAQGGRIAAVSAEAGVFAALTGRYSKNPNLDPVLQAHAGDSIVVDRRSRESERIERPALTMLASIQPYALWDMVARPDFAGRGMLARVLWSLAPDLVGKRKIRNVRPVPDSVRAAYDRLVRNLAVSMAMRAESITLTLSAEAAELLLAYAEHVERLLLPKEELGKGRLTREWGSKLVGAVARIAGCLHAAGGQDLTHCQVIDGATMSAAVRIGEYFRAHAVAALGAQADDGHAADMKSVLARIVEKGESRFTVRELHRGLQRKIKKADDLREHLDELADLGWLRRDDDGKGYQVHPEAKVLLDRLTNPGDSGDSGDNPNVPAGHSTYGTTPHPVTTPGDPFDSHAPAPRNVTAVTAPGDTFPTPSAPMMTSGNASTVTAVNGVTAPLPIRDCAACGEPMKVVNPGQTIHPDDQCEALAATRRTS